MQQDIEFQTAINRGTFTQPYKTKSNTSLRTQIVDRIIQNRIKKVGGKTSQKREAISINFIKSLKEVKPAKEKSFSSYILNDCACFFTTKSDDTELIEQVEKFAKEEIGADSKESKVLNEKFANAKIIDLHSSLKIVDEVCGCALMESENIPVFVLLPRKKSLKYGAKEQEVESLREVLQKKKAVNLGKTRIGLAKSYSTLGAHANRGKSGVFICIPPIIEPQYHVTLRMLQRAEKIAKKVIPYRARRGLRKAKSKLPWLAPMLEETAIHPARESKYWSSIATSCNYISPAHTDVDMFLCMITASCNRDRTSDGCFYYRQRMPIAFYMVFPEVGLAVGIRPGDHILFNPLHYHCVSMRERSYEFSEVYITSFYLNTAVVGMNNNKLEIDENLIKIIN